VELLSKKPREEPVSEDSDDDDDGDEEEGDDEDDEELSELEEELDDEASISEGSSEGDSESEPDNASKDSSVDEEDEAAEVLEVMVDHGKSAREDGRKRKRKQRDEYDNLESKYLNRLADDEEEEPTGKRLKGEEASTGDAMDISPDEDVDSDAESSSDNAVPVHESLSADPATTELEKANRTVFLSNVSAEAVTSRQAKKTLMNHLSSILDKKASPPQKIESIRFRSTAFATAAIPKRAAYIKKSVMEATTKSTNAYVVYSSTSAARLAVSELNGTTVLDRHLRVDSVAHPAAVDHKRCVFVGNLGFVDDESVINTKVDEEGKEVTEKKKRTKVPMDVEEGLWRVFSKEAGKVESVRVVRDPITRVGKGFAYVQFYVSPSTSQASRRHADEE
jgi:nucleolar protein 12